ncbi:kelch-like protein diablo [Paramacrobiotus metropolitanus]|uniref:kelch-like protein diablo n=1 Tax=Paramacrobiotus metropolitanus TaxID=2943436 RepID=UPI002445DC53|nr:kelch-like protein diablo [Paramacrobiotus metropolitanus]
MFLSGSEESKQEVVYLQNISSNVLSQLIDYCYMTEVFITEGNVQPLLIAALFLDIVPVVAACWQFLEDHMDVNNCLQLYSFANSEAHNNPALAIKAKALVLKHFVGITQGAKFLEIPKEMVIELIRSDDLHVQREDDVFSAVVRWHHHDFPQRRCQFWEILQFIRPLHLSAQGSDDYLLACFNSIKDYSAGGEAVRPSDHLKALPGYDSQASSLRRIPRKSYAIESLVICAGGHRSHFRTSLSDSVECFNPRTSKWKNLVHLPYAIARSGLIAINEDLFVCGGIFGQSSKDVTPRAIRYSSSLARWDDVAPMNTGRGDLGIAAIDGYIYAVGGHDSEKQVLASVERYDGAADQWAYKASLPTPLEKLAIVGFEGKVFVFGGCTSNRHTIGNTGFCNYVATDSAFCYDPKSNLWSELPRMPTARYRASACAGSDGLIYVIGGVRKSYLSCVEAYNPRTKQWTNKKY